MELQGTLTIEIEVAVRSQIVSLCNGLNLQKFNENSSVLVIHIYLIYTQLYRVTEDEAKLSGNNCSAF